MSLVIENLSLIILFSASLSLINPFILSLSLIFWLYWDVSAIFSCDSTALYLVISTMSLVRAGEYVTSNRGFCRVRCGKRQISRGFRCLLVRRNPASQIFSFLLCTQIIYKKAGSYCVLFFCSMLYNPIPLTVNRYFWRGWWGESGYCIRTKPSLRAGVRE